MRCWVTGILMAFSLFILIQTGLFAQDTGRENIIPGKLIVVLEKKAVNKKFVLKKDSNGSERIKLSKGLKELIAKYGVKRIRRRFPQCEIIDKKGNGKMRSYGTYMVERQKQSRRKNKRAVDSSRFPEFENYFIFAAGPEINIEQACIDFKKEKSVKSCQPIFKAETNAPFYPDDLHYPEQWGFHNTGENSLEDFDIDAPEAWGEDSGGGSEDIIIAIIDPLGIDYTHPDLYENIWINEDELPLDFKQTLKGYVNKENTDPLTFVDFNDSSQQVKDFLQSYGIEDTNNNNYIDGKDLLEAVKNNVILQEPDDLNGVDDDIIGPDFESDIEIPQNDPCPVSPDVDDRYLHGTAAAGLAAARTNNSIGYTGVAWNCRIMAIRGAVANATAYAVENGANVICQSGMWDTAEGYTEVIEEFSTYNDLGVVSVGSLGNDNTYTYGQGMPARMETAITMTNFDKNGLRPGVYFLGSSYGIKADVAGPGQDMYTCYPAQPDGTPDYGTFGGTSSACPIVAGVAALILSQHPELSPEQVRQVIRKSAVDITEPANSENVPGFDIYSGYGLVNAYNAVTFPHEGVCEANITEPTVNFKDDVKNNIFVLHPEGDVAIRGFAGQPGGAGISYRVEYMKEGDAGWTFLNEVSEADYEYQSNGVLGTLNIDALEDGIYIIRLVVTKNGMDFEDRARLDIQRAFIANIKPGETLFSPGNRFLTGFAFGSGFEEYRLEYTTPENPGTPVVIAGPFSNPCPPSPSTSTIPLKPKTLINEAKFEFGLLPSGNVNLRLVVDRGVYGDSVYEVPVNVDASNFDFQEGWGSDIPMPLKSLASPGLITADITGDGKSEILFKFLGVTPEGSFDALLNVYNHQHKLLWQKIFDITVDSSNNFKGGLICGPTAGDLDRDGKAEIGVMMGDNSSVSVHIYNYDGTPFLNEPITIPANGMWDDYLQSHRTSLLFSDIDKDGYPDIIFGHPGADPSAPRKVFFYKSDGTLIAGLDIPDPRGSNDIPDLAIADMDGDGYMEIAAMITLNEPGIKSKLYCAKIKGGEMPEVWSQGFEYPFYHPLIICDVDNDGDSEIIASATDAAYSGGTMVRIFHHDGTLYAERNLPHDLQGAAVGDIDNDDIPELIYTYEYISYPIVGALEMNADLPDIWETVLPAQEAGYPEGPRVSSLQPIVCNVDEDSELEVIVCVTYLVGDYNSIFCLNHDGSIQSDGDRWPIWYPGTVQHVPVIDDIDNDNDLELLVDTSKLVPMVFPSYFGYLFTWDLPYEFNPGEVGWGMYKHDICQTGNYNHNINILEPYTNKPVSAGTYNDPAGIKNILIRLYFDMPVKNLQIDQFTVTIGEEEAEIITGDTVYGEYWLVVRPPVQDTTGHYNLKVRYDAGIPSWDVESACIHYTAKIALPVDYIDVIDRTFSMIQENPVKMEAAIAAGKLFVNLTNDDDRMGVVSYACENWNYLNTIENKTVDELEKSGHPSLMHVHHVVDNRPQIIDVINTIWPADPYTHTPIGAGLLKAKEILGEGNSDRKRVIIVLSDGLENRPPFWVSEDPIAYMSAYPEFSGLSGEDTIHFHTVAIGEDADHELMQEIAGFTPEGEYWPLYLGNSLSLPNRMADTYKSIGEDVTGHYRIWSDGSNISFPEEKTHQFTVPEGLFTITVAVNWLKPVISPCSVTLFKPDGTEVTASTSGVKVNTTDSNKVYHIINPPTGQWTVKITTFKEPTEYFMAVSGYSHISMIVKKGRRSFKTHPAMEIPLFTILTDSNPIPWAEVTASIQKPGKTWEDTILYDDGNHGDGGENDGIYGTLYTANDGGYYLCRIRAKGVDSNGGEFEFEKTISFNNPWENDNDLDGLPDWWEAQYFNGNADKNADPDGDGVRNLWEYKYETDPTKPDTDGDGVDDGTEIEQGTNPAGKPAESKIKRFSLSLHGGYAFPVDDYDIDYDPFFNVTMDVDYHFTKQLSLVFLAGISMFKGGSPAVSDTYWMNASLNLKFEFLSFILRPYINAGGGIYIPDSGPVKPGFNVGAGLDFSFNQNWILEGGMNFHSIIAMPNMNFIIPHIGIIVRF